jgi:hypothetical protein
MEHWFHKSDAIEVFFLSSLFCFLGTQQCNRHSLPILMVGISSRGLSCQSQLRLTNFKFGKLNNDYFLQNLIFFICRVFAALQVVKSEKEQVHFKTFVPHIPSLIMVDSVEIFEVHIFFSKQKKNYDKMCIAACKIPSFNFDIDGDVFLKYLSGNFCK